MHTVSVVRIYIIYNSVNAFAKKLHKKGRFDLGSFTKCKRIVFYLLTLCKHRNIINLQIVYKGLQAL